MDFTKVIAEIRLSPLSTKPRIETLIMGAVAFCPIYGLSPLSTKPRIETNQGSFFAYTFWGV